MKFVFLDFLKTKAYTPSTPYKEGIGGTQSAICYYCEYLVTSGHEVVLVNGATEESVDRGVFVKPLTWVRSQTLYKTDVLVLCGGTGTSYVDTMERHFAYTLSIAWHGHYTFEPAVERYESIVYSVDYFAFVSEFQRNQFMDMYQIPLEKTIMMIYGVSPSFLQPFDVTKKELKLLYISAPDRGLEAYQEIWPIVHKAVPEALLEVYSSRATYGGKDSGYVEGVKRTLSALPNVHLHDPVGQSELSKISQGAAFMVYPTHFVETSCICFFETSAAGCLSIISDLGVFPYQAPLCVRHNASFVDEFAKTVIEQLHIFQSDRDTYNRRSLELSVKTKTERNYTKVVLDFVEIVRKAMETKALALSIRGELANQTNKNMFIYRGESMPKLFSSKLGAANFFLQLGSCYFEHHGYQHMAELYFLRSWSIMNTRQAANNLFLYYEKQKNVAKMFEWYFKCVPFGVQEYQRTTIQSLLKEHPTYSAALGLFAPTNSVAPPTSTNSVASFTSTNSVTPLTSTISVAPVSAKSKVGESLNNALKSSSAVSQLLQLINQPPTLDISEPSTNPPNPWAFFRKTYIINLERCKDRKERCINHLTSLGFPNISVFKAFDASKNYEIIKEQALRRKIVTEGCVKELSKGALGCLMSHYKLWEHEFLQKKKDEDYWVLIVEDDVLFHPQLKNEYVNAYMTEWPADARFVKLGWMFNDYWHSKNIASHNKYYVKFINNGVSSMTCYAVRSTVLEELLSKTYEHAIDDFALEGAYGFKPFIEDSEFNRTQYKDVLYKGVCADVKDGSTTIAIPT